MDTMPQEKKKWYFSPSIFIIAFLCVGPIALPLIWFNPGVSRKNKIIITVVIILLSYLIGIVLVKSVNSITEYYKLIMQ